MEKNIVETIIKDILDTFNMVIKFNEKSDNTRDVWVLVDQLELKVYRLDEDIENLSDEEIVELYKSNYMKEKCREIMELKKQINNLYRQSTYSPRLRLADTTLDKIMNFVIDMTEKLDVKAELIIMEKERLQEINDGPQIGDTFIVRLKDITNIIGLNVPFPENIKDEHSTGLQYIGNGKYKECFTGIIIHGLKEFKNCDEYSIHPLAVRTKDLKKSQLATRALYLFTPEEMSRIIHKYEWETIHAMQEYYYDLAYAEDMQRGNRRWV